MKYKALFIHIPKTGGSSICKAPFIIKHGSPDKDPNLPLRDLDLLTSFTFVRNPYTRFTSAVFNHGYATPDTFEDFVFGKFIDEAAKRFTEDLLFSWAELQPQYRFVYQNGKKVVKYIGRFENIRQYWNGLCALIDEEFELSHENKSKVLNHTQYLTPKIKEIIYKVYQEDFKRFGYEKNYSG